MHASILKPPPPHTDNFLLSTFFMWIIYSVDWNDTYIHIMTADWLTDQPPTVAWIRYQPYHLPRIQPNQVTNDSTAHTCLYRAIIQACYSTAVPTSRVLWHAACLCTEACSMWNQLLYGMVRIPTCLTVRLTRTGRYNINGTLYIYIAPFARFLPSTHGCACACGFGFGFGFGWSVGQFRYTYVSR